MGKSRSRSAHPTDLRDSRDTASHQFIRQFQPSIGRVNRCGLRVLIYEGKRFEEILDWMNVGGSGQRMVVDNAWSVSDDNGPTCVLGGIQLPATELGLGSCAGNPCLFIL